jgi:DNA polymerase III delta subunit
MDLDFVLSVLSAAAPEIAEKLIEYRKKGKIDYEDVSVIVQSTLISKIDNLLDCVNKVDGKVDQACDNIAFVRSRIERRNHK